MALYRYKPKMSERILHILEYVLVLFLYGFFNLIPYRYLDNAAGVLVFLLWPVFGKGRDRIRNNLQWYRPEWTEEEKNRFIRANLRHTLRVSLEVFQTWKFTNRKFMDKYLYPKNEQSLTLFTQRTSGIVGIEGHFGNWELPISFYHHHGVEVVFSAKHLKNPFVDRMVERQRRRYGGSIVYLDESNRFLGDLKKGNVVGLVADQDAGRNGIFVDFLGKKASAYAGPATLAYLSGTPILLCTAVFKGKGKYEVELSEVMPAYDRKKGIIGENGKKLNKEETLQYLTQGWCQALAKKVAEYPEQYFWVHRRWKTRPPEESKI